MLFALKVHGEFFMPIQYKLLPIIYNVQLQTGSLRGRDVLIKWRPCIHLPLNSIMLTTSSAA